MKPPLRAIGLVVGGLVSGLLVGGYLGFTMGAKPIRELTVLASIAWASTTADIQYQNAGYAEAREALEAYITVLQRAAVHPELNFTHSAHSDMGLAYTRLALLAEANGMAGEAPALMAKAVEEARAGGFRDPSAEHLRAVVLRLSPPPKPTPKPGA